MKTTAGEVWKIQQAIAALLGMRFEPAVSFRIRKFTAAVKDTVAGLEEARQDLVKRYGSPDTNGRTAIQDPQKLAAFNEAWTKLLQEEVELPDITITVEELTRAKLVIPGPGGMPIETTMTAEELADTEKVVTYANTKD